MESLPIPPRPSFFKSLNAANNANQSSLPTANNNHSHPSSPPTYSRIQQQAKNRDSPKFSSGRPPPPYPTRTSSSSLQQRPLPVPNVGSGNRSSSINERGNVTTFFQNRGEYFLNEKKFASHFKTKKVARNKIKYEMHYYFRQHIEDFLEEHFSTISSLLQFLSVFFGFRSV